MSARRRLPDQVTDTNVDVGTRRALLDAHYRAEARRATRPRLYAMRVLADDGWWYSSPGRPLLAGDLLACAVNPKPPSPNGSALEPVAARARWARAIRRGVTAEAEQWLSADVESA